MSKILKDSTYNDLKSRADAFDRIMAAVENFDDDISVEEQADLVIGLIETDNTADTDTLAVVQQQLTEANEKIESLRKSVTERDTTISQLQEELDNTPGAAPARISSKEETSAEPDTLVAFANKNAGDTDAILNRLKEEGLL